MIKQAFREVRKKRIAHSYLGLASLTGLLIFGKPEWANSPLSAYGCIGVRLTDDRGILPKSLMWKCELRHFTQEDSKESSFLLSVIRIFWQYTPVTPPQTDFFVCNAPKFLKTRVWTAPSKLQSSPSYLLVEDSGYGKWGMMRDQFCCKFGFGSYPVRGNMAGVIRAMVNKGVTVIPVVIM